MRPHRAASGLTVVEVLVAAAVAAIVLALLAATVAGAAGGASRLLASGERAQRRALAWELLRHELELAGRGLQGEAAPGGSGLRLALDAADGGGDRLGVRYLDEAHREEPRVVEAWFFAAEDGRGRPNLYRQPPDAVRQPWLLGVTGVRVIGAREADGARLAREALAPGMRLVALEVEMRFADDPPLRGWASITRAGPLGDPDAEAGPDDATGAGAGAAGDAT